MTRGITSKSSEIQAKLRNYVSKILQKKSVHYLLRAIYKSILFKIKLQKQFFNSVTHNQRVSDP